MIIKINNKKILFIHIPKTGGSSIETFFSNYMNINLKKIHFNKDILWGRERGKNKLEYRHLTMKQVFEFLNYSINDFDGIFTIVREPIKRFQSFCNWKNKDPNTIITKINNINNINNWTKCFFLSQYNYIEGYEKYIKIYKFEDGINIIINKIIKDYNLDIQLDRNIHENKSKYNKNINDNIKSELYVKFKKDFEYFNYPINNIKNINNQLKFIHITKTSGSYIEKISLEKKIYWGINDPKLKYLKNIYKRNTCWHEPIIFLNEKPYNKNIKLFTIIRNPYDRIISECFCNCGNPFNKINTIDDFNKYINYRVNNAYNINFMKPTHHFLPQHLYTHDSNNNQAIDYIIKYEEIEKFNELMKKYSIDINYIKNTNNNKKFGIKDINKNNIKLINKVYHFDFKLLNYDKINL